MMNLFLFRLRKNIEVTIFNLCDFISNTFAFNCKSTQAVDKANIFYQKYKVILTTQQRQIPKEEYMENKNRIEETQDQSNLNDEMDQSESQNSPVKGGTDSKASGQFDKGQQRSGQQNQQAKPTSR